MKASIAAHDQKRSGSRCDDQAAAESISDESLSQQDIELPLQRCEANAVVWETLSFAALDSVQIKDRGNGVAVVVPSVGAAFCGDVYIAGDTFVIQRHEIEARKGIHGCADSAEDRFDRGQVLGDAIAVDDRVIQRAIT